ncbi:cell division topological specificity factor MinE [Koleobacter methoxysyntrophicus]|uniref:cell division topological specificity factor MinE n=1 Tax=Koleobacter methoxysyntrophicus TaxID=2751313 RepID=UPI0019D68A96|nr:cell division topological specificity factor MinE [Koleobacter methoxysyntrophicus]
MDILKIFGKEEGQSKEVAKERLRLLLVHDRANVSPRFLEMIKGELIKVFSDYMEIEEEGMEIQLTRTKIGDTENLVPALIANIPIKRMKHIAKL